MLADRAGPVLSTALPRDRPRVQVVEAGRPASGTKQPLATSPRSPMPQRRRRGLAVARSHGRRACFNNAMVSRANARARDAGHCPARGRGCSRTSRCARSTRARAIDNVDAGVLYLGRLLRDTGGDPALGCGGLLPGLASVRRIVMLPETRRYVAVLALRGRFGG